MKNLKVDLKAQEIAARYKVEEEIKEDYEQETNKRKNGPGLSSSITHSKRGQGKGSKKKRNDKDSESEDERGKDEESDKSEQSKDIGLKKIKKSKLGDRKGKNIDNFRE